jgi:predicted amidophosphoribosyltransferase
MSRLKLQWYNLEEAEGKDPVLKIPICDIYSGIIDRAFPELDHIGWREGGKGTCYTYLKNVSQSELENLRKFLELLKQILCLTITDHLQPPFTNELTEAYAIDYTFKQEVTPLEYTNAGRVEHAAKTNQDARSIDALADVFADIINSHPTLLRSDIIASVPARPSSAFHLPARLVEALAPKLGRAVGLDITKIEHPKLKTLSMDKKILALEKAFTLRGSVRDKTVVIIDDLFQSGATLWSLARFLKQNGAADVFGLACVKSWSDTDNV